MPQFHHNNSKALSEIKKALKRDEYSAIVPFATQLIEYGPPSSIDGYLFRGIAFENGDDKLSVDLRKATDDYRQLVMIAPTAVSYQYLARALMKQGHENYPAAIRHLEEARSIEKIAEIDLGFAEYFLTKECPDYNKARDYFLRAALKGRFMGFFGYSKTSRLLNQPLRALSADCLRIIFGPLIALIIGGQARHRF